MIRKTLTIFIIFIAIVTVLTLYNYRLAQERLRQSRPSILAIELIEREREVARETRSNFRWRIDGPESFSAVTTGIYWGYDSTPSAVTRLDSPKALAYPNYTDDYLTGQFRLPDTFDVNLIFSKAGVVYYRAYAKVGNDHLWTEEKQILVK